MTRWMVVLGVVLGVVRGARADVDRGVQAKADVLFEQAQADYEGGKYQAAIELFKQAFDLVHDPVYLYNIAQSYRRVLACEEAFDYYQKYLEAAPAAENKVKVQGWLRELQPCAEQRKRDHEAARRAEEAEQARHEAGLHAHQAGSSSGPSEIDRGRTLRIAGIATGVVGLVGIGIGVRYGMRGTDLKKQVAEACSPTCQWDSPNANNVTPAQLDKEGKRANKIAAIGYIGGGVAAIAGAGLYVLGRARIEHVTITPAEGGATVSALLRF